MRSTGAHDSLREADDCHWHDLSTCLTIRCKASENRVGDGMLEKLRGLGLGLLLALSLVVPSVARAAPSWQGDDVSDDNGNAPVVVLEAPSSPVSTGQTVSTGGLTTDGSAGDRPTD